MRTEGSCGNCNRHYGIDPLAVLRGRLMDEREPYVVPDSEPAPAEELAEEDELSRCEHGIPLADIGKCADCAWLYGWEKREAT